MEEFDLLTLTQLLEYQDNLAALVPRLEESDLALLLECLWEKEDQIRYAAFLLLQLVSTGDARVYRHWDTLAAMLDEANSYQRSLGLMLIAENVRWDKEGKFGKVCRKYLEHCDDEKFVTSRQCIQGLLKMVDFIRPYHQAIVAALCGIDLANKKDTQRGLLLLDIAEVLERIDREHPDAGLHDRIESYLREKYELGNAKAKQKIKAMLGA